MSPRVLGAGGLALTFGGIGIMWSVDPAAGVAMVLLYVSTSLNCAAGIYIGCKAFMLAAEKRLTSVMIESLEAAAQDTKELTATLERLERLTRGVE